MRKKNSEFSLSLKEKTDGVEIDHLLMLHGKRCGYADQLEALKIKQFLSELFPKKIADQITQVKKHEKTLYLSVNSPALKQEIQLMTELFKKRIAQELKIEIEKIYFRTSTRH